MNTIKDWSMTKVLAVVLCILIAAEANMVLAGQETPLTRFNNAKQDYLNGDFKACKTNCELIVAAVDESKPENRSFLGHSYLLLAASEEKLNEIEPARRHYQKAAELLGDEPATIEGIVFIGLVLYTERFAGGQGVDMLVVQFNNAKGAYFREKYEDAKLILEKLITQLGGIDGRDTLKGQTYLLAGATYEKLDLKELSVRYYCRAKAILGVGKTFEGLDLRKLIWYDETLPGRGRSRGHADGRHPRQAARSAVSSASSSGSGSSAGLVWYLFFSKNAPFKKKDTTTDDDDDVHEHLLHDVLEVLDRGGMDDGIGTVTLTPDVNAGNYPKPSQSNNWEDQVTYTLSATGGGTLASISLNIDLEVGGGDNAKRQDIVTVDGSETAERHELLRRILQRAGEEDVHGRLRPGLDGDLHPQAQGRPVQDARASAPGAS